MLRDPLLEPARARASQPGLMIRRLLGRIAAALGFIAVLPWVVYWIVKALLAGRDDEEEE